MRTQRLRRDTHKSTRFDESQKPLVLGTRKVTKNRTSKAVILPKIWVDANNIEVGDKLEFRMERDGTLSVQKYKGTVA